LPDLAPCDFSVSLVERPQFLHNWGDGDRIAGGAEHPHRSRLPGCILKMAEALGIVHTRGRGLLQGWWWSVGPKLGFDKMAATVPGIMDTNSYFSIKKWYKLVDDGHH
jgi:hypothetical protein